MEDVLYWHSYVAECAVFGVNDELKGQIPVGLLVVLKAGVDRPHEEIGAELVAAGSLADRSGRRHSRPRRSSKRLPKTRSGKILRGTMRRIADGEEYSMPATIDDPAILGEIEEALAGVGYAQESPPV